MRQGAWGDGDHGAGAGGIGAIGLGRGGWGPRSRGGGWGARGGGEGDGGHGVGGEGDGGHGARGDGWGTMGRGVRREGQGHVTTASDSHKDGQDTSLSNAFPTFRFLKYLLNTFTTHSPQW